MHSRFSYLALFSAAALAFSGCEWGGAHEDTWNDGYSWADFTGTYRFVQALIIPGAGDPEHPGQVQRNGQGNGVMATSSSAAGKVSPVGVGIVPGSFSMDIGVTDDENGNLYLGERRVGSISYSTGSWKITEYVGVEAGTHFGIKYTYLTNGLGYADGDEPIPISYLNVTQQGNKFTMTSSRGVVYKGRITGANVGKDDWQAARTVHLSFEVASADGMTITGNFSGMWSGASDKSYGTLSNIKMNATHSRAGNFVGVAADKSLYVYDATSSETGPTFYSEPSNQ